MTRNISLIAHSEELKILAIALNNKDGTIKQSQLKEKNIDFRAPIDLMNLGYLKKIDNTEYPYCDYSMTKKGRKYAEIVYDFLDNYKITAE